MKTRTTVAKAVCVKCGHDDVDTNGVCCFPLAKVPSSVLWVDTHCRCRCVFPSVAEAPDAMQIYIAHLRTCKDCLYKAAVESLCSEGRALYREAYPSAEAGDGVAIQDLLDLMEQDSAGNWCFKSLSGDNAKFQQVINRLAASTSDKAARDSESV